MANVTIFVDGTEVVNRDVDNVECEETAGGTLDLHATFPPIDLSGLPATGTFIE
jgi:hypothetical protein